MSARRSVPGVDFARVRADLKIDDEFSPETLQAAKAAAAHPRLPDADDTAIPFVTLDPPGSMDLDQAVHIAREGTGYLVSYAIADVAAFVEPGGPIDAECWERGQTMYCPDRRVPLHPDVLCEDAASLLPDVVRPAVLWEFHLDADANVASSSVRRTKVRSIANLDYEQTQKDFDSGRPHPSLELLKEVGERRLALAAKRNAINLDLPEQNVEPTSDGSWTLVNREQLPCERWNAEISLMTGMAAGAMMVDGGVGILRTLPPAEESAVKQLAKTAGALGIEWPPGATPASVIDSLDRSNSRNVAFIEQAAQLLRGAGYLGFIDGHPEAPHSAIGATYAHVTAPLRRLVDRYGSEACLAVAAGEPVPGWVADALPKLPEVMQRTGGLERRLESAIVDTVEALLLAERVGDEFAATVVGIGKDDLTVILDDPAVRARATGNGAALGDRVRVRVDEANPAEHTVRLSVAGH